MLHCVHQQVANFRCQPSGSGGMHGFLELLLWKQLPASAGNNVDESGENEPRVIKPNPLNEMKDVEMLRRVKGNRSVG